MDKCANRKSKTMIQPSNGSVNLRPLFNRERLNCMQEIAALLHSAKVPKMQSSVCLDGSLIDPFVLTDLSTKANLEFLENGQASCSYLDCQSVRVSRTGVHGNTPFAIEVSSEVFAGWGIMGLHVESPFDVPSPRVLVAPLGQLFPSSIIPQERVSGNKTVASIGDCVKLRGVGGGAIPLPR